MSSPAWWQRCKKNYIASNPRAVISFSFLSISPPYTRLELCDLTSLFAIKLQLEMKKAALLLCLTIRIFPARGWNGSIKKMLEKSPIESDAKWVILVNIVLRAIFLWVSVGKSFALTTFRDCPIKQANFSSNQKWFQNQPWPVRTLFPARYFCYLTIIHRAQIGYWLRAHEGERNNFFSKIQRVGQKISRQNIFR